MDRDPYEGVYASVDEALALTRAALADLKDMLERADHILARASWLRAKAEVARGG